MFDKLVVVRICTWVSKLKQWQQSFSHICPPAWKISTVTQLNFLLLFRCFERRGISWL